MEAAYTDITSAFFAQCAALPPGEYAALPNFDMQRAISAIELFSPKMDSGLIPDVPVLLPLPFELTPDVVIAVFDRLRALEMAYLRGTSAAESVWTCLLCHEDNLSRLDASSRPLEAALKALLMSVLKCCAQARALVEFCRYTRAFFEEDFSLASTLGLVNSAQNTSYEELQAMLDHALALPQAAGVSSRLRLCQAWLRALNQLVGLDFAAAEASLKSCEGLLLEQDATRVALAQAAAAARFFNSQVNLKRLMPVPSRPPLAAQVDEDTASARSHRDLVRACRTICASARACAAADADLAMVLEALELFAELDAVSLARALMVHALAPEGGGPVFGAHALADLVRRDVDFCCPADAPAALFAHESAGQPAALAWETMMTLCASRARRRRQLVHRLEEWGSLLVALEQFDASRLGLAFGSIEEQQQARRNFELPLGCWAAQWAVRLMNMYLDLGCGALELYQEKEALSLVVNQALLQKTMIDYMAATLRWKKLDVKNLPPHRLRLYCLAEARRFTAYGCMQTLMLCIKRGVLAPRHKDDLSDARLVFEHRFFDPFSTIWLPSIVMYNDIEATLAHIPDESVLFDQATQIFKTAKQSCTLALKNLQMESSPCGEALKQVLKRVIVNSLTVAKLRQARKARVEFVEGGVAVHILE